MSQMKQERDYGDSGTGFSIISVFLFPIEGEIWGDTLPRKFFDF